MTARHREDGPAIEYTNGYKEWYKNDKLHREDGPAILYINGRTEWYRDDKRHRLDGPAVIYANGDKEWYKNGMLHREDGPAIEYADGAKAWYVNDKLHRLGGPAVECVYGYKEWYRDGKRYTPLPDEKAMASIFPEYKSAHELKIDANEPFFNLQNLSLQELQALKLNKQHELESIDKEIKRHVKINELRNKINLHQDEVNYYSKELDPLL